MHLLLSHNEAVFKTYSPSSNFQLLVACTVSYYHTYCSCSTVNAAEVLNVLRNIQSKEGLGEIYKNDWHKE
jgi:hypothetical protein